MKTAFFVLLPIPSHYYPTFGLARLLEKRGYKVVYTGKPELQDAIEREGFDFEILSYVDEFIIRRMSVAVGLFLKSRLDSTYMKSRYRDFLARTSMLELLIGKRKPDITFLDDTLGHYYSILASKTKVVQLSTKLSPRKQVGIPPLNCFWQPRDQFGQNGLANWYWFWHIIKRRLKHSIERIVLNGRHEAYFQQRYDRKKGFDTANLKDENVSFYDGLKNIQSVVLAPQEIEFAWKKTEPNEFYMPLCTVRDESNSFSSAYQRLVARLLELKQQGEPQIVYVSLGTLARNKHRLAKNFLLNVVSALNSLRNIEVVVSTGGINLELANVPTNVALLPTVPQLHLLPFCDLMITHGGLGTIKECLENGVPMLVYPLNARVDQPGNSARIVSQNLGLRGRITDPAKSIRQKVHIMLNTSFYRTHCEYIQQRLKRVDESQLADELLQRLGLLTKDSLES